MNSFIFLESAGSNADAAAATGGSFAVMIGSLLVMFAIMYFFAIRPQKKQEREHLAIVNSVEIGDSILTTSGFYGTIIDVTPDIVIVEFGNNKNCRIPMKKDAIVDVEKVKK